MLDPLNNFDWKSLYGKYDAKCEKGGSFKRNSSSYLGSFQPTPTCDRMLYYALIERFANRGGSRTIDLDTYEGMLYWKLYSQPAAVKKHCERLRQDPSLRESTTDELARISEILPATIQRDIEQILRILTGLTKKLHGMAWTCAIPVRTTLLHFAYPGMVPIFDKQVLQAVGVKEKDANHSYEFLREYLPHAWCLADRYKDRLASFKNESAVRVIDMALWISRGK